MARKDASQFSQSAKIAIATPAATTLSKDDIMTTTRKSLWAGLFLLLSITAPLHAELPTIELMTAKDGLVEPFDVDMDPEGNLYVIDYKGHQLWKIGVDGKKTLLAGTGKPGYSGDGGPALDATFKLPHVIEVNKSGEIYIADTMNSAVRLYDPKTKNVTAFAGNGTPGFAGDGGPASAAIFNEAYHLCLNKEETRLLITDLKNKRLREVDLKTGIIDTIAGTGKGGYSAEGADVRTNPLNDPRAAVYGWDKEIYLIDRGGHLLQMIDADGKLTTLAGHRGTKGNRSGDGTAAHMNGPKDLCLGGKQTIYVCDTENHVIRTFDLTTQRMNTLAISGMKRPHGVYYRDGKLYIADSERGRLLQVEVEAH